MRCTYHEKSKHIVIVGAGPSGLFAALSLSALGHEIVVMERMTEEEISSSFTADFFNGAPKASLQRRNQLENGLLALAALGAGVFVVAALMFLSYMVSSG